MCIFIDPSSSKFILFSHRPYERRDGHEGSEIKAMCHDLHTINVDLFASRNRQMKMEAEKEEEEEEEQSPPEDEKK